MKTHSIIVWLKHNGHIPLLSISFQSPTYYSQQQYEVGFALTHNVKLPLLQLNKWTFYHRYYQLLVLHNRFMDREVKNGHYSKSTMLFLRKH